jgi:hypothetical protein
MSIRWLDIDAEIFSRATAIQRFQNLTAWEIGGEGPGAGAYLHRLLQHSQQLKPGMTLSPPYDYPQLVHQSHHWVNGLHAQTSFDGLMSSIGAPNNPKGTQAGRTHQKPLLMQLHPPWFHVLAV